jgi:hypothetical protein
MKTNAMIALVCLIAIGALAFSFFASPEQTDDTLDVKCLNVWANVPLQQVNEITDDKSPLPVTTTAYNDLNDLISSAGESNESVVILDAMTYLEYHDVLSHYAIYALRPKSTALLVDPKHASIEHINDIKGAVLGIAGQASDEYIFRAVIDMEGIIGLSLDEIDCTKLLDKVTLLTDSIINYAIMEAPFDQYVLTRGARRLYRFDNTYDALLVPENFDDDQLRRVNTYIAAIDGVKTTGNTEKWMQQYFPELKRFVPDEPMITAAFDKPDSDIINQMVTYFYATNRIDSKYKLSEIVVDGFK